MRNWDKDILFPKKDIGRLLFLFCVLVLAVYPVIDAFADCRSLSASSDIREYLNDVDDAVSIKDLKLNIADDLKPHDLVDLKQNNCACWHGHALHQEPLKNPPACVQFIQIPTTDVKSALRFRPRSTDLSPPLL